MYRLNLFTLHMIARELILHDFEEHLSYWVTEYVFEDDHNYGADKGVGCEKKHEWLEKMYASDFVAIDDIDDIFDHVIESDVISKMYVSEEPGIKYCLKDKNRLCHEECYGDDEFCEMVVFLGYPEDEVKYPNAYPIYL